MAKAEDFQAGATVEESEFKFISLSQPCVSSDKPARELQAGSTRRGSRFLVVSDRIFWQKHSNLLFVFSMCFFWGGESGSYTLGTTVSLPVSSTLDPELARSDGLICEYERGER